MDLWGWNSDVGTRLWNPNGMQRLPYVSGKRNYEVVKQTELFHKPFGKIESLKREEDRIFEKTESLQTDTVWMFRYCKYNMILRREKNDQKIRAFAGCRL